SNLIKVAPIDIWKCGTQSWQACALAGTAGTGNDEHHCGIGPFCTPGEPLNGRETCRKARHQAISGLGTEGALASLNATTAEIEGTTDQDWASGNSWPKQAETWL